MRRINWACVVTVSNLLLGFFAVLLRLKGHLDLALWALVGAFVGDGVDGTIARRTNMTSVFGERLDSLSDLIGFGVAPVFFALHPRTEWDPLLLVACSLYLAGGAIRLARYDPLEQKNKFRGMPIPISGLLLTAFSVVFPAVAWYAVVPALLGILMVSDIPFAKVKFGGRESWWAAVLGAVSLLVLLLSHELPLAMLAFGIPYLVVNLMLSLPGMRRAVHGELGPSLAKE